MFTGSIGIRTGYKFITISDQIGVTLSDRDLWSNQTLRVKSVITSKWKDGVYLLTNALN